MLRAWVRGDILKKKNFEVSKYGTRSGKHATV